jgi:DNA-binding NtrC family response regulator
MTKRILVVDDDRQMVTTLCDILGLHGWETSRGHDGSAATEMVVAQELDLVLMDVVMPTMNGVEALRAIKKRRPETRVILMTAYAAGALLAEAEREGVFRILAKPVQLPNLLSVLDEAVD